LGFNVNPIQTGGATLGWQASLMISSRLNTLVGETYATATRPDTKWAVVEFYVDASYTSDPNAGMNLTPTSQTANPCTFFNHDGCIFSAGGGSVEGVFGMGSLNPNNNANHIHPLGWQTRTIEDKPIGTKFCVAVAVSDRDSTYNDGFGQVSGGLWRITQPQCIAIGKMPMVNVLGGGMYSDGDIVGGTFRKQPDGETETGAFGSWAEHEIVSNGIIRSFASGAALGVGAAGVGGIPPFGGTSLPSTIMINSNIAMDSCRISPLTYANISCSPSSINAPLGLMGGAATNQAFGRARDIRHRYTGREGAANVSGTISLANHQANRINYVKANGNLTINGGIITEGRTVIIESAGTVTITGNIILHDGLYTDVTQIPQVLIFAQNVDIDPSVTRVDAWLLAGLNGGDGIINTCNSVTNANQLSGDICNNQLRINGPVMASRVLLHRTYGAGVGMPASANPAEVFFLSPATYLWAYNQTAILRQAFLTYAREVAPRF
jgi:hypothetical protein